jgi:aryl-alcohol dehydrogenase-like predicted oxidoreductase
MMRHLPFGNGTGLMVSELALGTGNFGTSWAAGSDRRKAQTIFDRFADAGGTFIDTANSYQYGDAERYLADFLVGRRDEFVVATKYTQPDTADAPALLAGNSRKNMMRSLQGSLRRLRTDYVDLLWVHMPDGVTPIEEVIAGLDDLISAGHVRYGGLSSFPAWVTARAVTQAGMLGRRPIIGIQVEYSLARRQADEEQLPMADMLGLGAALFSPLGGGLLTGKYRQAIEGRMTTWMHTIRTEDSVQRTQILDAVLAVAAEVGAPPASVALAWVRAGANGRAQIPIIGPRTIDQLDDYLKALDLELDADAIEGLDQASK